MKTKMMLAGLVTALTFASCSKDETNGVNNREANSVGFEIGTGKTRAAVVDLDKLKLDAAGFGVYATNGASAAQFIDNAGYKYEAGAWKWAVTDIMWPANNTDYPINFYAYYPKSGAPLAAPALTANYTVVATPALQTDYLAASHTGVAIRPASGDVTLAFKHILSKIDFKVVTGDLVTVEVQSIAVRKVGETGTFSFASLSWTTPPSIWSSGYDYMTAPVESANIFVGATTAASVTGSSGSLMLIPQDLSGRAWDKSKAGLAASQSYIEVVYRAFETGNADENLVGYTDAADHPSYPTLGHGLTGSLFVKVAYPLPTNWQMGKSFTYTISLGTNDAAGGNLIEDNFVDKDGNDSGLPVVNPDSEDPINVPDPVFPDKPIGFIVSVDNWDTSGGNTELK